MLSHKNHLTQSHTQTNTAPGVRTPSVKCVVPDCHKMLFDMQLSSRLGQPNLLLSDSYPLILHCLFPIENYSLICTFPFKMSVDS